MLCCADICGAATQFCNAVGTAAGVCKAALTAGAACITGGESRQHAVALP